MASCSQPPPDPAIPTIPSQPSDIELAKMLIDPSASPPGNITIHNADVYAHDPADLTQLFAAAVTGDGQKVWYFSTKLEPKNDRGKRKRRCMDSGVWRDEGKSKPVVDVGRKGREIGHRSLFSFVNKVHGARTGWIMHEFRLPVNEESPVVLCKVFRSSRRCAMAQAQQVEVEEEEALVKAVEAREAAVKAREEALAARETTVEAREALARRDAADLAVSERNLQERHRDLAAREAAVEEREAAWRAERWSLTRRDTEMAAVLERVLEKWLTMEERAARESARHAEVAAWWTMLQAREGRVLAWQPGFPPLWDVRFRAQFERRLAELEREVEPRFAQFEREAELAREAELREAEGEALARREAARLAVLERNLQERERNLAAREAAFNSRLQALQEEFAAELEAMVLILMAAAVLVARAGLLLPPACGSRAATVAHCGGELEPLF